MRSPLSTLSFKQRGYITLFGGFLIHFILGTLYLWGSVNTYISSYLVNDGQNYNNADVGAVFPFMVLAVNVGNPFGVTIAKKIGYRLFSIICCVTLSLSIFFSSFVLNSFPLFSLLYGFVFGLANGLVYMVPFNLCYAYFPDKKGLVSGVISAGYGFGATVFIQVAQALINPDNEHASVIIDGSKYFTDSVTDNLSSAIKILGIIYLVTSFVGCLLLEPPTENEFNQVKLNIKKQSMIQEQKEEDEYAAEHPLEASQHLISGIHHKIECQKFKDGIQTSLIWVSMILAGMTACFGAMMVSNYKTYGQTLNFSDSFLSLVGTLGSVTNGSSRLFWGYLLEKFSFKILFSANILLQMILSLTIAWVDTVDVIYLLYIVIIYFAYGGLYSMMPATITKIFGKKIGTTIYGVTFTGFTISSWFQYLVVKYLEDLIGWPTTFRMFTGIQFVAMLIVLFIPFDINWNMWYEEKEKKELKRSLIVSGTSG